MSQLWKERTFPQVLAAHGRAAEIAKDVQDRIRGIAEKDEGRTEQATPSENGHNHYPGILPHNVCAIDLDTS